MPATTCCGDRSAIKATAAATSRAGSVAQSPDPSCTTPSARIQPGGNPVLAVRYFSSRRRTQSTTSHPSEVADIEGSVAHTRTERSEMSRPEPPECCLCERPRFPVIRSVSLGRPLLNQPQDGHRATTTRPSRMSSTSSPSTVSSIDTRAIELRAGRNRRVLHGVVERALLPARRADVEVAGRAAGEAARA